MLNIFLLLLILSTLVSLYWGIHIIRLSPLSTVNRLFFILSLSLGIWSFGLFLANLSRDAVIAMHWHRFSALGWTFIFSIFLHYLLLISDTDRKNKYSYLYLLLYIPSFISVYVFALSNKMSNLQHRLIETTHGWTNVALANEWDYFYYLHTSLYIFISLLLIFKWKEKNENHHPKVIYKIFLSVVVLGIFTDLVASSFFEQPISLLKPIFILLPLWSLYSQARNDSLENYKKNKFDEFTISDKDQKTIYDNLSFAFYISAILAFLSEYLPAMNHEQSLKSAFLKGVSIATIGILIRILQNIKDNRLKEEFIIFVLVSSIPLILFQYLKFGSLTTWAFPLVLIISSVIFSKVALLFWITAVAIFTQIVIWILRPEVMVVIDKYDYILRIGIFIAAFLTGYYINKIYIARIEENKKQVAFQTMASAVSFDFVSLTEENFDEKINYLLKEIGLFFSVDRTYLFIIDHEKDRMICSNEWRDTGIDQGVAPINDLSLSNFLWLIDQLLDKESIHIDDVTLMPTAAHLEQAHLLEQDVKSLLAVPIIEDGKVLAFLGMDSLQEPRNWSQEKIEMLSVMANILHNGLMQVEADKEIEYIAYYDRLTNLPNRFLFEKRVENALLEAESSEKSIAIIFLDLDGFKAVNDTLGHRGGDRLLQKVTERLNSVIREGDTLARFGGDEFMILLDDMVDYKIISDVADDVMNVFNEVFIVNGQIFTITASAGIANHPFDGKDSDTLIKNADIAMYKAKDKGKSQYVFCSQKIKEELSESTELSSDLSRALERSELILYYQPQINLETNKITAVEALIRWKHPTKGMISPGQFIPLAEKTGLINPIGEWVLETACRQNKQWQEMGLPPINMAVNLSALQIINPQITEIIADIIQKTELNPKYLELEITETVAIDKSVDVIDTLNELKSMGISIAIDDFGTEYSSLSRLTLLPLNRVKIDMQFVQGIETNTKDQAIIITIIKLTQSLGLNALAEGVETAGQLKFLKDIKCNHVQGYYYYKPMPAIQLEKILKPSIKSVEK